MITARIRRAFVAIVVATGLTIAGGLTSEAASAAPPFVPRPVVTFRIPVAPRYPSASAVRVILDGPWEQVHVNFTLTCLGAGQYLGVYSPQSGGPRLSSDTLVAPFDWSGQTCTLRLFTASADYQFELDQATTLTTIGPVMVVVHGTIVPVIRGGGL